MKKNLFLALVAAIILISNAGCKNRGGDIQTSYSKREAVRIKPLSEEGAPLYSQMARELELLLVVLNHSNARLLKDCRVLLPSCQTDPQGREEVWLGYEGVVASTERPLFSLESMLGVLCVIEKQGDKRIILPCRLVVSEELTLLKRRLSILRISGVKPVAELEADLSALEQQVEAVNVLSARLCKEVRAAAKTAKNVPLNSPLGRLGDAKRFVAHLIEAQVVASEEEARDLERTVQACDAKFLLLNGVTSLQLTADGKALLDPKGAVAKGSTVEPKALPEIKRPKGPKSREKTGGQERKLAHNPD